MMSNEEMLQRAQAMRERGFPPMEQPPEQRPVTETVLHLPSANGRSVTVYEIRPQRGLPEHCPFFINYHGGGFVKGRADRDGVYCAWLADLFDALVLSAGKDKLCEEDEQFAARLAAAGVTVTARRFPRSQHGFTINRGGEWREALALHAAFFDAHLRPGKETTL